MYLGKLCRADDLIILLDLFVSVHSEILLTFHVIPGKVLPWLPCLSVIHGLLQSPDARSGGVGHGNHNVCDLEKLRRKQHKAWRTRITGGLFHKAILQILPLVWGKQIHGGLTSFAYNILNASANNFMVPVADRYQE